jgi:hypothetical protein
MSRIVWKPRNTLTRRVGLMIISVVGILSLVAWSSPVAARGTLPAQILASTVSAPFPIGVWRGEYYNNVNLTGSPLVRYDEKIRFDWGQGSPMAGINSDNFSVRWTRRISLKAGTYRFTVRADDGVRLWVDGRLLIDQWHDGPARTFSVERAMSQGQHDIRVEMYERAGFASASFQRHIVGSYPDWKGEYFRNRNLSGTPALVRNDASVDFDWGNNAPAPGLPADNFSVRWTRQIQFSAGLYRFTVAVDDGARLWVDGTLVVDQWHDGISTYIGDIYLDQGTHTIRLEMYEHLGGAAAHLSWALQTSSVVWRARFYTNRDLQGDPVLARRDTNIDFNWGSGAPARGLPADNFSVKWFTHTNLSAGTYRFCARADDGVSVEMDDGVPFIREWHDASGSTTYCKDVYVHAGSHKITVEYFEHLGVAGIQFWFYKLAGN